ncbi:hypothetical protein METH_11865 [Leisingera methylohalidivorans DSM 14336]|uniref:Uncharacterized protein n=1 Tax=Leisingera methylohalidivorans DSM 14336 TaxID=999552 RepID=V9W1Q7_9RHOB|nr:hypothetical protein METH_11865 [Leisingera methylohalidivorans DSM 14336]
MLLQTLPACPCGPDLTRCAPGAGGAFGAQAQAGLPVRSFGAARAAGLARSRHNALDCHPNRFHQQPNSKA